MDIFDIAIAKQLAGGGSGGGQPLYRHQVAIMADGDNDADAFQFAFYSTSGEQIEDMEQLYQAIRLTGDENLNYPVVSGTHYYADTSKYIPFAYVTFYRIFDTQLKDATFYLHLTNGETAVSNNPYVEDDIVTEIGTASVSGGGGSCQIVDLGLQEGHAAVQTNIIELLKPDTVPNGKYIYSYYNECMGNAAIAICYKSSENIEGAQITSEGKVRTFWYNFESGQESNVCMQPLGGTRYESGNNIEFESQEDGSFAINAIRPKLYAPKIEISGTMLTIKNQTRNKDYVGRYGIYNADSNHLIMETAKTLVDLDSLDIEDGTYNIAVKAMSVEFNGKTLYDDSDYSNILTYDHVLVPRIIDYTDWYKGTVARSTITEITFDNTYVVTGNETESWDASSGQNGSVMCYRNGTSVIIKPIHSTNKVRTNGCHGMFSAFGQLVAINNISALLIRMGSTSSMFAQCYNLESLDLSNFDTSRVSSMEKMFFYCKSLKSLDLSNFDTSRVTNMEKMFDSCELLALDCTSWNVDNVTTYTNFNYNAPNVTPPEWVEEYVET